MAGHKHAALMAEYAKDAAETERPWERWQLMGVAQLWCALDGNPGWSTEKDYRRKPCTLTIAGREIDAPMQSAHFGQNIYATDATGRIAELNFNGAHGSALKNGRLFATPEAAKAAYDAITAVLTGKEGV